MPRKILPSDIDDLESGKVPTTTGVQVAYNAIDNSNTVNGTSAVDFDNQWTILANTISAGKGFESLAHFSAQQNSGASRTLTLRLYIGSVVIKTFTATITSGLGTLYVAWRVHGVCRTGGASGNINAWTDLQQTGSVHIAITASDLTSIDWEVDNVVKISAQWNNSQDAIMLNWRNLLIGKIT